GGTSQLSIEERAKSRIALPGSQDIPEGGRSPVEIGGESQTATTRQFLASEAPHIRRPPSLNHKNCIRVLCPANRPRKGWATASPRGSVRQLSSASRPHSVRKSGSFGAGNRRGKR